MNYFACFVRFVCGLFHFNWLNSTSSIKNVKVYFNPIYLASYGYLKYLCCIEILFRKKHSASSFFCVTFDSQKIVGNLRTVVHNVETIGKWWLMILEYWSFTFGDRRVKILFKNWRRLSVFVGVLSDNDTNIKCMVCEKPLQLSVLFVIYFNPRFNPYIPF